MDNKNKIEKKELSLEELEVVGGGIIVKDEAGYHVINEIDGYEIHTFSEDQYDFMMKLVSKWEVSPEFKTWDEANAILAAVRAENRKRLGLDG